MLSINTISLARRNECQIFGRRSKFQAINFFLQAVLSSKIGASCPCCYQPKKGELSQFRSCFLLMHINETEMTMADG
jgi:hypothetical protein